MLITQKEIDDCVQRLADSISLDIKTKFMNNMPVFIIVMKGALFFGVDLLRKIQLPVIFDTIEISSYKSSMISSGQIEIIKKESINIKEKNVFIIEDILDTGNSLKFLIDYYEHKGAASVKTIVLINKQKKHSHDIIPDFSGISVDDKFIVGYGMDINDLYRNLPYIGTFH